MSSLDKAVQTKIDNIQKNTGKTLAELTSIVHQSGLTKHGEIREMLKRDLGLDGFDVRLPQRRLCKLLVACHKTSKHK